MVRVNFNSILAEDHEEVFIAFRDALKAVVPEIDNSQVDKAYGVFVENLDWVSTSDQNIEMYKG